MAVAVAGLDKHTSLLRTSHIKNSVMSFQTGASKRKVYCPELFYMKCQLSCQNDGTLSSVSG